MGGRKSIKRYIEKKQKEIKVFILLKTLVESEKRVMKGGESSQKSEEGTGRLLRGRGGSGSA